MAPSTQRPTRVRYWVIFFAVALSVVTYIDRVALSLSRKQVATDLHLSDTEMGAVFGAFALAYALFEVPSGLMGDKWGPRGVLMRIVLWWSAFTALTGMAWNFVSLYVTQLLFGAGEAGCFPNITRAFANWLPRQERVRSQGIIWLSARWGGAFTPILVAVLFNYMTWRVAFCTFGVLGVIWAIAFYAWFKDNPRDNPKVNQAELDLLKYNVPATSHGHLNISKVLLAALIGAPVGLALRFLIVGIGSVFGQVIDPGSMLAFILIGVVLGGTGASVVQLTPWRRFAGSRTVWLLCLQYFSLSFPWYFLITWAPTFIDERFKLDTTHSTVYKVLPLFAGGLGSFVSGLLSAPVTRMTGSIKTTRRLLACIGFAGACLCLVIATYLREPMIAISAVAFSSFFNDLVMPQSWGTVMDISGGFAGTLAGSMNMVGNLGGALYGPAAGIVLARTNHDWNAVLLMGAAVYLTGFVMWLFIDPVTPIDRDEKAAHVQ